MTNLIPFRKKKISPFWYKVAAPVTGLLAVTAYILTLLFGYLTSLLGQERR